MYAATAHTSAYHGEALDLTSERKKPWEGRYGKVWRFGNGLRLPSAEIRATAITKFEIGQALEEGDEEKGTQGVINRLFFEALRLKSQLSGGCGKPPAVADGQVEFGVNLD